MKIYKILGLLTLSLSSISPLAVAASDIEDASISIEHPTSLMLNGKLGGVRVTIDAMVMPVESVSLPPEPLANLPVVTKVAVRVNGKYIFVARSVFSDLIDPKRCSVMEAGKEWVLNIIGGDGADTYSLKIYFDARQVRRRIKYSGLRSLTAREETKYMPLIVMD